MTLDVGDPAPDFLLRNENNQEISLSSYRGTKAVLLVFYPLAFTGTCQGELTALQQSLPDFQNDRVQVLTVSVDSPYAHKIWSDRESYTFPLLSDFWPHGAVASAYGVLNEAKGYANRGTFLIDRSGVVRFREVLPASQSRDIATWREAIATL
ncbi:peroxiredoxin [Dactylosporangium sp. NPDC051485]|uniref:peroxiredoxin n=1 Tax=Dactylosporangium sp. NPDC051485 TaxID=3154846 RepID=UPI003447B700